MTEKIEQHKEIIDQNNKAFYDMKKQKDALQNERNVLWRQENSMQQQISSLRDELNKREQALRSITGKVGIIRQVPNSVNNWSVFWWVRRKSCKQLCK